MFKEFYLTQTRLRLRKGRVGAKAAPLPACGLCLPEDHVLPTDLLDHYSQYIEF